MRLETERLVLRPWEAGDVEAARRIFCDPDVRYFTGGAMAPENVPAFVARQIEETSRGQLRLQPAVEKASGEIVGVCGLQPMAGGPEIEIGWMLARDAWGKGYASEIACAILRYALEELKLPRVVATIDKRNARSVATVNRIGMRFDRVIRVYKRDMLLYEKTLKAQV